MISNPTDLAEQGKRAFEEKKFDEAARLFDEAAQGYTADRGGANAAEMRNNMSVALLQAGKAQHALDAADGTDRVFADEKDSRRQAMALGNQAAALETLGRRDEAITKYEQAAELFRAAGEGDMRAMVMKSAAALKLKQGKVSDSAFKMMGALEAKDKPSFFERILRFFTRFIR